MGTQNEVPKIDRHREMKFHGSVSRRKETNGIIQWEPWSPGAWDTSKGRASSTHSPKEGVAAVDVCGDERVLEYANEIRAGVPFDVSLSRGKSKLFRRSQSQATQFVQVVSRIGLIDDDSTAQMYSAICKRKKLHIVSPLTTPARDLMAAARLQGSPAVNIGNICPGATYDLPHVTSNTPAGLRCLDSEHRSPFWAFVSRLFAVRYTGNIQYWHRAAPPGGSSPTLPRYPSFDFKSRLERPRIQFRRVALCFPKKQLDYTQSWRIASEVDWSRLARPRLERLSRGSLSRLTQTLSFLGKPPGLVTRPRKHPRLHHTNKQTPGRDPYRVTRHSHFRTQASARALSHPQLLDTLGGACGGNPGLVGLQAGRRRISQASPVPVSVLLEIRDRTFTRLISLWSFSPEKRAL
ncbi:uncharacterized protein JN550_012760 [Neoarthrinium moseri]|uniref:uncharacterized protein n=1 Tax=Neoarthrinium moseri TaxID=1658444 RepID=UPI001FDC1B9A|nr:uncharacterized protein JN550_012760 [Neoarthrinium moseri]KAI1858310.1 hypothetical protein JN550_012760 [Neoarthrinium moseri]